MLPRTAIVEAQRAAVRSMSRRPPAPAVRYLPHAGRPVVLPPDSAEFVVDWEVAAPDRDR